MRGTRPGILSLAVAAVLAFPLGLSPALAEELPPSAPVETTQAPPPESTAPTEPAAPIETTEPAAPPATTAPPQPEAQQLAAQALAAPPEIVNDVPSISIELPLGYTVDGDLNASKDDIPADPDTEPLSMLTLVDPNDSNNTLIDVPVEEIRGRGNFTWTLDKKPYQFKFESSRPILGMQSAKTWILLANHADPSLLRNKVAYDLAAAFGLPGTTDSRFVDLTVNGEYLGSYLLTEKVEVKKNRLELSDPGGILLELDNNYGTAEDFYFYTQPSNTLFVLKDAVEDVDEPLPQPLAEAYADIQEYLDEIESHLYADDPDWDALSALIDVESFIKYYFVFEVAENPEITQSSVYFWRDGTEDVLHAGPVWDFDSAFAEYVSERLGGDPRQDYVMNGQFLRNKGNGWYTQLFRIPEFVEAARDLYDNELKAIIDELPTKIDEYAAAMPGSADANFDTWDVLGGPGVFNGGHVIADTWQGEVDYLRDWVERRVDYLDTAYGVGNPMLIHSVHVQSIGWQQSRTGGQIAGTAGKALRVEALDLALDANGLSGALQSRAHVQSIGWSGWQSGDTVLGTTGRSLRLEALQLRLTEQLAANFDIEYRAHVAKVGWMPWVEDGAVAGTTGRGLAIEAVQIRLVEREPVVGSSVFYRAHVAKIGWMAETSDGAIAGTTGQSLAMQALEASVVSSDHSGGIRYRAHVQSLGWMPWTDSPDYIGTVGRNLRMEALQIQLTGDIAAHYSIRYSAHVQGIGWQSWVADGQTAGTTGQAKRVEAIRIELVPKP
ncbi:CotH kinase family protein [Agromyces binzhouensis]|uniref:CotH kinase family protein n=1 Tax=Agromyces binzhouensis TaxID=1817495 RepID=UPI003645866D